jgi:hypothetical protein
MAYLVRQLHFHAPLFLTDDQITHEFSLDDNHDPQVGLDVFKVDPLYEQHETEYKAISREILGDESEDEEGCVCCAGLRLYNCKL